MDLNLIHKVWTKIVIFYIIKQNIMFREEVYSMPTVFLAAMDIFYHGFLAMRSKVIKLKSHNLY